MNKAWECYVEESCVFGVVFTNPRYRHDGTRVYFKRIPEIK